MTSVQKRVFLVIIASLVALLVIGTADGHAVFAAKSGSPETSVTLSFNACVIDNVQPFSCSSPGPLHFCNNIGCQSIICTEPGNVMLFNPGDCTTDNGVQLTSCKIPGPNENVVTCIILTPTLRIQNLINTIDSFNLPKGVTTSLEAPLNNAIKQLNRNHDAPVCNLVNAFLDQVDQKQTGGQLTSQQAANLRQQATAVETSLGCSSTSATMTTVTNNNNQESTSSIPSSREQQEQDLMNLRSQIENDTLSSMTK